MPQTEEEYRKTFESEKARTVVWLGFLSIILVIRVELNAGEFWNFPCNSPCPHITLYLLPLFTNWIALWFGYIGCMLIFFSEDRFDKYKWGRDLRELFRRIGTRFFVLFYPLTILFFTGFAGFSFQFPDSVQTPYWLTIAFLFGWYVIWSAEGISGAKVVGKRGVFRRPIESFLELGREGTLVIADALVRLWRGVSSKLGRPIAGPVNAKRGMRLFVSIIVLIVVVVAWGIVHLSGFDLFYAFGVPLYAIVLASVIVGWFKKRKRKESPDSAAPLGRGSS